MSFATLHTHCPFSHGTPPSMEKRRQTYNRLIYILKSTFAKVVIYFFGEISPLGKKLEFFVFLVWIWPKNAKKLENLPTFLTTKLKKKKTLIQRICSSPPRSTFLCTFLMYLLLANSSTITCHLASPNVKMLHLPFGIFLLKINEKEDKMCARQMYMSFLHKNFYFTLNNF
jgi:hypothetical protein